MLRNNMRILFSESWEKTSHGKVTNLKPINIIFDIEEAGLNFFAYHH